MVKPDADAVFTTGSPFDSSFRGNVDFNLDALQVYVVLTVLSLEYLTAV